ncbi:MAG: hypothetical protein ACREF4_00970 [Gammaproteobacteria bacterium]
MEKHTTSGPSIRDSIPASAPLREASNGNGFAKAKWENAPCSSVTDATGDGWASGRPASAKEISPAPKLWPTSWNRAGRQGIVDPSGQRTQALLPDDPGAVLHLPVGGLPQGFLGAAPNAAEPVADPGRTAVGSSSTIPCSRAASRKRVNSAGASSWNIPG